MAVTWRQLAYLTDVIAKTLLTEQGDIIYASGVAIPAVLPHGTSGQVLTTGGNAANPAWATPSGGGGGLGIFGDGSDNDVTIAANTTLTRDMFYNSLTVNTTIVLTTAGYRIFVKGTLTNNGTIRRNGNDAVTTTPGAALAAATLGGSAAGGAGNTVGDSVDLGLGGAGGAGGNAKAGGTVTAALSGGRSLPVAISGWETKSVAGLIQGGAGGGGGGIAGSAAGGGGAGVIVIVAQTIVNTNGIIQANGGVGGNTGVAYPGGGGGGGWIALFYNTLSAGTEQCSGGAPGTGGLGGAVAGSAGRVIKIDCG